MGNTANVVVGPAVITVDSVDIGFTKDGISVRSEREYLDVACDQLVGLIKKSKTMEKMLVKTTLLEASLANLYMSWDLPLGSLGAGWGNVVNEHTVGVVGPGPAGATLTFAFDRAVSIGNSEVMWSREAEVALEVEFECLKNSVGQFGTLVSTPAA